MKQITKYVLAMGLTVAVCATTVAQSGSPKGRVIRIDESLWIQLSGEPAHHMEEAHKQFANDDRMLAAENTRKVAVYLRISAANSPDLTREVLMRTADDVQAVSKGIQTGSVVRLTTLERCFSRAEHALARHHHALAKESWTGKQTRIAGYRMRAASSSFERAAKWSGEELDAGSRATVDTGRRLGGSMIKGTGIVVDEIGRGLNALGNGITKFGERVKR